MAVRAPERQSWTMRRIDSGSDHTQQQHESEHREDDANLGNCDAFVFHGSNPQNTKRTVGHQRVDGGCFDLAEQRKPVGYEHDGHGCLPHPVRGLVGKTGISKTSKAYANSKLEKAPDLTFDSQHLSAPKKRTNPSLSLGLHGFAISFRNQNFADSSIWARFGFVRGLLSNR